MKGKSRWAGLVLVVILAAACARPTPEPAFWTEPCHNLPPDDTDEMLPPTQGETRMVKFEGTWYSVETLEMLPFIPTDTPVEVGDFIVQVGNFRWTYEYFPYTGKPVRSECPWLPLNGKPGG